MASLNDIIPDVGPVSAGQRPQRQAAALDAGGMTGAIGALTAALGQLTDPLAREVARGFVEGQLSTVFARAGAPGVRIRIPLPEEQEAAALEAQVNKSKQMIELSTANVAIARARLIDLSPEQRKRANLEGVADPLVERPDEAIRAANAIGIPLTRGMLALAAESVRPKGDGLTTRDATAAAGRRELEGTASELRARVSGIESSRKLAEEGQTTGAELVERAKAAAEDAYGVDITSSFFGPDTDIDEEKGAGALNEVLKNVATDPIGRLLGPAVVAEQVLARFGSDMAAELRKLPQTEDGAMVVGQGSWDIDEGATFELAAAVFQLAKMSGASDVGAFMREKMGLPFTDIDTESFVAYALKKTGGDREDAAKLLESRGVNVRFGGG